MPSHAKPDTEQATESVEKPNEINGLQIMVDNEEGVCYSMNCRRNTVGITRIWRKEMSKVEMFDLHFQIPVSK